MKIKKKKKKKKKLRGVKQMIKAQKSKRRAREPARGMKNDG